MLYEEAKRTQLETAAELKNFLEQAAAMHQKGGVCYETAKELLGLYYKLKYDKLKSKIKETFGTLQEYEYVSRQQRCRQSSLEDLLSITDQQLFCYNALQSFVNSGNPVQVHALVSLIELSMKLLREVNADAARLLQVTYFTKKGRTSSPDYAAGKLGLPRTSYYRERDKAITVLSEIIFGCLGNRHPQCKIFS